MTTFNAAAFSEEIAAKHLRRHGAFATVTLSDGSQVIDCTCGAPIGVFHDDGRICYTIDEEDIEAYR